MNAASFPNEIELGREDNFGPVSQASGKKGKALTVYPTLYIEGVEGLSALPKDFCIMIKGRRKRLSVEENADGKEMSGVTLEIQKLCLSDDMTEDEGDDMESAMKDYAKGKGVDTGSDEPDDDDAGGESDDDGDEE